MRGLSVLSLSVLLIVVLSSMHSLATDVSTLKNQLSFQGEIDEIKNCQLYFRSDSNFYVIPIEDLIYIEFGDLDSAGAADFLAPELSKCLKGKLDAPLHGRDIGNGALGFFFGPFGIIGAALGSPSPYRGGRTPYQSENKALFNDQEYLKCYKKRQRGRAVGHAAIGWLIYLMFIIVISYGGSA